MDREFYTTDREIEILNLIVLGLSNSQIAAKIFVSTHTVKAHLGNLYKKFHVYNRVQLVIVCVKHGIIDIKNHNND